MTTNPSGLPLVFHGLFGVLYCFLDVLQRTWDVEFDSVDHFSLNEDDICQAGLKSRDHQSALNYLWLDQHCHVHEHIVQFSNWIFQLDNIRMTGFNIGQCLFGLLCVRHNLNKIIEQLRPISRWCHFKHTPCVNMAGFPLSSISSNSSLVVDLPAGVMRWYDG